MKIKALLLLLFLLQFSWIITGSTYQGKASPSRVVSDANLADQNGLRLLLPLYVRLEALQKNNITFWQSLPQNFTSHVATIDLKLLAVFIPSNSLGFNLSTDAVGNLWMSSKYSLNDGESIGTLTWVSSETVKENLTSIDPVSFPSTYPADVLPFLEDGSPKIPTNDSMIRQLAAKFKTENMTETVRNVIDFVARINYDANKTKLQMSGNLTETNILDFFKNATEVLQTNSSMCLERAWLATAILRAASVPTRTVTDVRLKNWIEVWLPEHGWIDAEALCVQPPPMFPRPLSSSTPWMIENASDAKFPFSWLPTNLMRVTNLTFVNLEDFSLDEYGTVLSQPVDQGLFAEDPTKFTFPVVFEPDIVYAGVTQTGSTVSFSLITPKQNVTKTLTIGKPATITLNEVAVSFKPLRLGDFLVMKEFTVSSTSSFDVRILLPVLGIPLAIVIVIVLIYLRRRKTIEKQSR